MGINDSKHIPSSDQTKEGSKLDKKVESLFKDMTKDGKQCVEFEALQKRLNNLPYDTRAVFDEHQGEVWKYGKFSDFVRPFLAIVTPGCALFPFTDDSHKSDLDLTIAWLTSAALATGCEMASTKHPCLIAAAKHLLLIRCERSISPLLMEHYSKPMRILLSDISMAITGTTTFTQHDFTLPAAPNGTAVTKLEYWIVFNSLPPKYFASRRETCDDGDDDEESSRHRPLFDHSNWLQLYNSDYDGLSLNRFEKKVFDYRGYTVAFLRMADSRLFAVGMDRTWVSSSAPLGGVDCCCIQVLPEHERSTGITVKCMTTSKRDKENGLHVVSAGLEIASSMDGVASIEVFGCADATALAEQKKQKQRMQRMADKNKEVPLPGQWEENPDRSLLEMAGVGGYQHGLAEAADRSRRDEE